MDDEKRVSPERLLEEADWSRLLKELHAFAGFCFPNMPVDHRKELVSKTLEKVLTGDQGWDPQKRPKLLNHLKLVFRSVADSEFQSAYCRKRGYVSVADGDDSAEPLDTIADAAKPIDEACAERDLIDRVFKDLEGDYIAELVFTSLREGMSKTEIANDLAIDKAEVEKAIRRIRYRGRKMENQDSLEK
jgi:DNA-directed RNA polymerase specialized sigma24 family protein